MLHTTILLVLFLLGTVTQLCATATEQITIDPTVINFDSIPKIISQRTFVLGTVQDTSTSRNTTGIVGTTRVRHRKTAFISCNPPPAMVVERSMQGLLATTDQKGRNPSIISTIDIVLLEFSLTETSKIVSQSMEANIVLKVTVNDPAEHGRMANYVIKSQNSTTMLDTSKHASAVLRGAIEGALKEIVKSIIR